jgi:hypothetical protein
VLKCRTGATLAFFGSTAAMWRAGLSPPSGPPTCIDFISVFLPLPGSTHVPTHWCCSSPLPLIEAPSHGGPARAAPPSGSQILGDSREHSGALDGLLLQGGDVAAQGAYKFSGTGALAGTGAREQPQTPQAYRRAFRRFPAGDQATIRQRLGNDLGHVLDLGRKHG